MSTKQIFFLALSILFLSGTRLGVHSVHAQDDRTTNHAEGLRENPPQGFALTNAKIVVSPDKTVPKGTVVIRHGKIVSVLPDGAPIPEWARHIDLQGKTIYPGLIDAYAEIPVPAEAYQQGAPYWNSNIRPQVLAAEHLNDSGKENEKLRSVGVTARLIVPQGGILKGQSTLVTTGKPDAKRNTVVKQVAQHARLTVSRRFDRSATSRPAYPNSPMGAVALARQAMYDANWYLEATQAAAANPSLPKPDQNDSLESLEPVVRGKQPLIIDSSNELFFLRADRFAREFNLKTMIVGSGFEFRRLDDVVATGRPILLPVNFPSAPNVSTYESALEVSLETLMEWDIAPENPARLENAGASFAFTSNGLDDPKDFLANIRKAVDRGLSESAALKALTIAPARLFGAANLMGTIEQGKLANLVVTDGSLFDQETEILETWVQGVQFPNRKSADIDLNGKWQISFQDQRGKNIIWNLELVADRSVAGTIQFMARKPKPNTSKNRQDQPESIELIKSGLENRRFSATVDTNALGFPGVTRMTFVFGNSNDQADGFVTPANDSRFPATLSRSVAKENKENEDNKNSKDKRNKKDNNGQAKKIPAGKSGPGKNTDRKNADPNQEDKNPDARALFAVNYPLGAFGRSEPALTERVLIRNVTIWTCAKQGVIQHGDVLLENGKISAVGTGLKIEDRSNLIVVDGTGKHLTPGIIDCHSHMASDGGINESGQAITAEVRIGDFINCNDINIYRQLAGGVTSSNILHGSANPIGGQNQVIKLRWGSNDEAMKFREAPAGIKFALGENVKRSRDRSSTRYPRTRMGVEQIFMDEFRAALGYRQQWKRWNATREGLPPRRNLELDAIVEILEQDRWIHCHSYRQDEILALIRLLDGFGIRIGTFQHILEGYKVADEMKKHGAMGSAFADWWAYKFEVYDAIPYAGALMHNAGVVVSFNSDDRELARHLNHEAAKAVKYGGVPPEEALKFVTLNPAKQLRIDQYVGSIEIGKHADVVLWSGDPLSTMSRCEITWVDGKRMFDRQQDLAMRKTFAEMKRALVQKVLASGEKMNSLPGGRRPKQAELWPAYDEFCRCKGAK